MIGFFGGSFDPPHFGHLHLATELMERAGLKEVWFCPTSQSPFKNRVPQPSNQDRLKMVELAIEGYPHFRVIDDEIQRGGISYTIDTLRHLKGSFRLIIGEDALAALPLWKESAALVKLAPPLVGSRGGWGASSAEIIPIPLMDISSSVIRDRLKKGLPCNHLVPTKVLDYILSHRLYSSSNE